MKTASFGEKHCLVFFFKVLYKKKNYISFILFKEALIYLIEINYFFMVKMNFFNKRFLTKIRKEDFLNSIKKNYKFLNKNPFLMIF